MYINIVVSFIFFRVNFAGLVETKMLFIDIWIHDFDTVLENDVSYCIVHCICLHPYVVL